MGSMKSAVAAVAMAAGGLVAAAGPGATESVASAATVGSCASSQVTVSHGAPQGTAGTTYVPIIFTNTGAKCAIWGVPAIQPVAGSAHRAVGPLAHSLSMGEMPVRHLLAKGRSVSVAFGVVDTGNFTPSTCVARSANGVIVTLDSFVRPTYVHLPIAVCTKRSSTTTKLIVAGVNGY
jgi:hypothetical protein